MIEPLVSVITITYNHGSFITRTIEGVLMQKTDFPFEFIIAEDCSTDNTREIIQSYADKYPKIIRIITSDSNVGAVENETRALLQSKGKFVAFCEGDDYWTDPLKLQKQVDFLENHQEYSVCFHRCQHYYWDEDLWEEDKCGKFFGLAKDEGVDVTPEMFFKQWITQPLTMVFRMGSFNPGIHKKYKHYRDIHQIYHLLKAGKGYLFSFIGGVRLIHQNGMAGMASLEQQCQSTLEISRELYKVNLTPETKQYYEDILQWCIYEYCRRSVNKTHSILSSFELFILNKSFRRLLANLKRHFFETDIQ